MLEYDMTDVSDVTDLNKTGDARDCIICQY